MSRSKSLFPALPRDARKGERTRRHVIESAYLCISRDGYHRTTFQTIADRAKISQPLVVKIFGSKERIFPIVAQEIFAAATALTVEHLRKIPTKSQRQRLEAYIEVTATLFLDNPDLRGFFMNLYSLAAYEREIQKILTAMRAQALGRLQELTGHPENAIRFHDQLTGAILNSIALEENWNIAELKSRLLPARK